MSEPDNRSSNRNKTQMFQSQTQSQSATGKIEAANILAGYKNNAGAYDELLAADQSNAPILFLEPSCYSMFVEDYRELKRDA